MQRMVRRVALGIVLVVTAGLHAADYVWLGTNGVAWDDPANWDIGAGYPLGAADSAAFTNGNQSVTAPSGLELGALLLDETFSGTLSLAGTLLVSDSGGQSGNLTIKAGKLQTAKDMVGDVTVTGSILIGSNGVVIARRKNTTGEGTGQTLTVGSLTVDGALHADGEGFDRQKGPGYTNVSAGGTYGGKGSSSIKSTYGSLENPTALGSGATAAGGGAVLIVASGTVAINGVISAGAAKTASTAGGAGGTVNITANALTGNGIIRANGTSGSNNPTGGGGRISLTVSGNDTFCGTIQANGGGALGRAGTIWLSATRRNNLILGGAGNLQSLLLGTDDTLIPGGGSQYVFGYVTIEAGGRLEVDGNHLANYVDGIAYGTSTILAMNSLEIKEGGLLTATGLGFYNTSDTGPGAGSRSVVIGGSHGGRGINASDNGTYGSAISPSSMGSSATSRGGGAILLAVNGPITLNGTISADGVTVGSGMAGAGGSVNVQAATLTGSGSLQAKGGSGQYSSNGGGGRVSVCLSEGMDFGNVKISTANSNGSAGTIYLETAGDRASGGLLRISTPSLSPQTTPLPASLVPEHWVDELRDVILEVVGNGIMSLTTNIMVRNLYLNGPTESLFLNGHTIRVRSPYHADANTNRAVFAGGDIIWQRPGTVVVLR